MSEDAERELAAFLAALPVYQRKVLNEPDSAFTNDEINQQMQWLLTDQFTELSQEHMRLIQRVPAKLKEYKRRLIRAHGMSAPDALGIAKGNAGRPRDDAKVDLAERLKAEGLSWAEVARRIHKERGKDDSTTGENLRSLVKSRKHPRKKSKV